MKHIYISFDVISDEIIDAFVRKNDEAAKRDFIQAFKSQSRDDTHVQLFIAYPSEYSNSDFRLEGIPCKKIWDSAEFEESKND